MITSSGGVECWGDHNGSNWDTKIPNALASQISLGKSILWHLNDGTIECWGSNANDQGIPPQGHLFRYQQEQITLVEYEEAAK